MIAIILLCAAFVLGILFEGYCIREDLAARINKADISPDEKRFIKDLLGLPQ